MSEGEHTSIFAPVILEKCAATWPRWRKAHRVRRKSVPLHLLPSTRSPPLIFWTFCMGGDKRGYGMTSWSQAAPTGWPKPLLTTVCQHAASTSSPWGDFIEMSVDAQHYSWQHYSRGWGRTFPTSMGYARYTHYSILHGAPSTEGNSDGIPQSIYTSWGG